ncbi:hypothetical protein TNCT_388111 [Trichonephila clavata]|uniref:Uncharacterized protein n=1 Tax=Trichonephila clavata TaxID=2740835 RepID=A0A8X6J5J5_TRICU|nr:hypothetical protein TNCT_388111 [Trichonephila clavata]
MKVRPIPKPPLRSSSAKSFAPICSGQEQNQHNNIPESRNRAAREVPDLPARRTGTIESQPAEGREGAPSAIG